MNGKKVALYGILIAAAMILSYVEAQIPAFFAVPGMKLGLTNAAVLISLYILGNKSAVIINVLRILLVSLLFGNVVGLAYSLAGGILSGVVMILLKRTKKFGIITVSVAGAISHNVAQIFTAMAIMGTSAIVWYLLVLWFTGIASGLVIGILSGILCKRLEKIYGNKN